MQENVLMDKVISLAKRRGFVFPGSEIYGGLANSWDFGPLGVELKNNIKKLWWRLFVQERDDMAGIDGTLIMNPKVWEASGHLKTFSDPLAECQKCHQRFRADQVKGVCPNCGSKELTVARQFNLMFKTFLGPVEDKNSVVYLRPETAQTMFVDFKQVLDSTRLKIPFGIAQIGRSFRNEITPGNFIFRTREFEQMEIEYFIKPKKWEEHFEHWLAEMKRWVHLIGLDDKKVHYHEIPPEERAFYSQRTIDIEFDYPFGREELYGLAYRTDYDLSAHQKMSGQNLEYTDPETGEKFIPHVIEPSLGVERTALAVLLSAYTETEARSGEKRAVHEKEIVLKLPAVLAPVKAAILPLSRKEELTKPVYQIYRDLQKHWMCQYDEAGSIGKRYRRQDEIGTPFCVTFDFDSLKDKKVTVRDRDTMEQERVVISELDSYLKEKLEN